MRELRRLGPDDLALWADLRHALWPHHDREDLAAELPDAIAGGLVGFMAFEHGRPVGLAEVDVRSYGDGCETAPVPWLEGIYVVPEQRRSGVARQLLQIVEDWARRAGHAELGSDAELDNLVSRVAHARWGFEETGRSVMFRKVLK